MTRPIRLPGTPARRPRKNFRHRISKVTPVRIDAIDTQDGAPPTLRLKRRYPKCTWLIPPITAALYWFDMVMLRRGLIAVIGDNLFIVDGRRFRVIVKDRHEIGIGYTRWLVYEENPLLPNNGKP